MNNYKTLQNINNQIGVTMGSILTTVAMLIFLGFMGSKIAVFYMDNKMANKSLQELAEVPYITKKSKREIAEVLRKRFQMDTLDIKGDEIIVVKRTDK